MNKQAPDGRGPPDQAVWEAFERWLALEPAEREFYATGLSASDARTHSRLMRLVDADRRADAARFLAGGAAVQFAPRGGPKEAATSLPPHEHLGPWTLERSLGAGGMGQVWLARRHDGLYQGQVAIKMLRADTFAAGANARFAREGQILARLSHPGIARLLDAGVAETGRRYLVLEYVDGERIDHYSNARRLSVAQRVALVISVCDAVAHAHANLVVHRDLKPSNILVGQDDRVKLLDFGVAKLIEQDADATQLTGQAGAALTPEYAAPEQVCGDAITVATDVYGLGAVLYRLLAGCSPYGREHATPAQLARDIVETIPVPMARQLEREDVAAGEIAAQRGTMAADLRRTLTGDLQTIVGKALKKDPAERYPSVQALADDLSRYLASQPIAARRDSFPYRARLFVRRNALPVAFASVALLAVMVGAATALWQASEANEKARVARTEAAKVDAVKQFLLGLFEANSTENGGGAKAQQTTARELLDIGRKRIDTSLKDQPEVRTELLGVLSEMYHQIGRMDEAEHADRERVEQLRAMGRDDTPEMAHALREHSQTLDETGHEDEAIAAASQALAILDRLGDRDSELRAQVLLTLADAQRLQAPAKALPLLEESVGLLRTRHPDAANVISAVGALASTYQTLGRLGDARRILQETLPWAKARYGVADTRTILIMGRLASDARYGNRPGAAQAAYRELYEAARVGEGETHENALVARAEYGLLLAQGGDREGGLANLDAVNRIVGVDPAQRTATVWGRSHMYKASALLDAGDADGAARELDLIEALWARSIPKSVFYLRMIGERARQRGLQGALAESVALAERARALMLARGGPCHAGQWRNDDALARSLQAAGRYDDALPLIETVERCHSVDIDETPLRVGAALARARDGLARAHPAQALAQADDALARISASADRRFFALDEAEAHAIAAAALATGNPGPAQTHLRAALGILEAREIEGSPRLAQARAALRAYGG